MYILKLLTYSNTLCFVIVSINTLNAVNNIIIKNALFNLFVISPNMKHPIITHVDEIKYNNRWKLLIEFVPKCSGFKYEYKIPKEVFSIYDTILFICAVNKLSC